MYDDEMIIGSACAVSTPVRAALNAQVDSKTTVLEIDPSMSDTSGRAVANKAIKKYVDDGLALKADKAATNSKIESMAASMANLATSNSVTALSNSLSSTNASVEALSRSVSGLSDSLSSTNANLANKSDVGHTHSQYALSDNMESELRKKADKATTLFGYGITNAYTKTEVNELVSGASIKYKIVDSLPQGDISTSTVYMIRSSEGDFYEEWMMIEGSWTKIGVTGQAEINLSEYVSKTGEEAISNKTITSSTYNGYTLKEACAKDVDSEVSATSLGLPTSKAVAEYVGGRGFSTTDTTYSISSAGNKVTLTGSNGTTSEATINVGDALTSGDVESIANGMGFSKTDTNTTYSLSNSQNTITLTGSDNTSSSVTIDVGDALTEDMVNQLIDGKGFSTKDTTYTFEGGNDCFYYTPKGGQRAQVSITSSKYVPVNTYERDKLTFITSSYLTNNGYITSGDLAGNYYTASEIDGMGFVTSGSLSATLKDYAKTSDITITTVSWDNVTEKPTTFPPSSHTHSAYLPITGGSMTGGLSVTGRVAGTGDDYGIVIGRVSGAGKAQLTLGAPASVRSVMELDSSNNLTWSYATSSTAFKISHPKKSGTIALLSDMPSGISDTKTAKFGIPTNLSNTYVYQNSTPSSGVTGYKGTTAYVIDTFGETSSIDDVVSLSMAIVPTISYKGTEITGEYYCTSFIPTRTGTQSYGFSTIEMSFYSPNGDRRWGIKAEIRLQHMAAADGSSSHVNIQAGISDVWMFSLAAGTFNHNQGWYNSSSDHLYVKNIALKTLTIKYLAARK